MSFQNLLTDRCNIYHVMEEKKTSSFGIPGETTYEYADNPDAEDIKCYWTKTEVIVRTEDIEPMMVTKERFKVYFNIYADIRHLDKAEFNGNEYLLSNPTKIKNHHIEVTAEKITF